MSARATRSGNKRTAADASPSKKLKVSADVSWWHGRSLTSTEGLEKAHVDSLFAATDGLRDRVEAGETLTVSANRVVALAFMEPSTRTQCSFAAAVQRLGGSIVSINGSESSVVKGETLGDTARCLEQYCDATVVRHPKLGSAAEMAKASKRPVINAGDGPGEHPTQALLDLYTMLREGATTVESAKLNVTFLGDARYGRTVHSLSKLFASYDASKFRVRYVTPDSSMSFPKDLLDKLATQGLEQSEHTSTTDDDVLKHTDVLYVTRVQKERFTDLEAYERARASFVVNLEALNKYANPKLIVMHPLPRVGEISEDVDEDPRAAYFRQMKNGMYVRMGLIASVMGDL